MNTALVVAASLAYLGLLFGVAWFVEHSGRGSARLSRSSIVYTLSLAVYCSSWTFAGGIGRASQSGIDFLPTYLGPTLAFCLGSVLIRKVLRVSRANRITSIADLIGARFGKSTGLAALVTVIAVVGMVPYLALQLKSISTGLDVLAAGAPLVDVTSIPVLADGAFWAALVLTVFAMLFGSRSLHPDEHHPGMVVAVALESILKLVALTAVGLFVGYGLFHGFGDLFARGAADPAIAALYSHGGVGRGIDWLAMTLLAAVAILCLPRQFQVMVVENVEERHLDRALWLFPLYLLAINLFVLPIAVAGRLTMPAGDPDSLVLTVPLAAGAPWLALVAFLGGLSASASMVVVEATALSLMVCNDVVMPALLRWRSLGLADRPDLTRLLLWIRRAAVAGVMALGYLYMRWDSQRYALVSIGLMSFVAVAQFAPAIVGGLFWRGASKAGAVAGISAGFAVWLYTEFLPTLAQSGSLPPAFVEHGLFGASWLRPYALFGLDGLDPITHGFFWTMLANLGAFIGVSLLTRQSAIERAQAALFVDAFRFDDAAQIWRRTAHLPDLVSLAARFLGRERADVAFAGWARERGVDAATTVRADAELVLFGERLLAGVVGAASARVLVGSVVQEEPLGVDEVMRLLDETSRLIQANRALEEKSRELEDATANLKEANARLTVLDRLKDDFVATVNHELRTPLTSIRTFSEILRDHPELPIGERQEFLRVVVGESERLTRLINQLLDLSKIEADGISARILSPLDLAAVAADCAASMRQVFAANRVALSLAIAAEPAWTMGDRDRLVQVVVNLLANAAKFSPPGRGRVTLSVVANGDTVEVAVADNGPGVPPAEREVVFERFRQGGDPLTDKPGGVGLGLAICQRIVAQHGGSIWVEDAPGGGALFRVRLPRAAAPAAALTAAE